MALQGQLTALGVSSAKASLDTLLAGYYSIAFAAIRHMLEIRVQCLYVAVKPEETTRWYRHPEHSSARAESPKMFRMVEAVNADPRLADTAQVLDSIYASWKLMSKGSHPTGEGIKQTVAGVGQFTFGATYDRHLALIGFHQGLYAVGMLLKGLSWLRPQDQTWRRPPFYGAVKPLIGDITQGENWANISMSILIQTLMATLTCRMRTIRISSQESGQHHSMH